jgi:hypothetical protein
MKYVAAFLLVRTFSYQRSISIKRFSCARDYDFRVRVIEGVERDLKKLFWFLLARARYAHTYTVLRV